MNGGQAPSTLAPLAALEHRLYLQVRQLRQQGASPEAVTQALIGTLLAWEFRDKSTHEPKFNLLVQHVSRSIQASPELDAAMREIAVGLRERP
jgi:hypothetical protein